MAKPRTCDDCGTVLPEQALHGLCPRCLAGMALDLAPERAARAPWSEEPGDTIGRFKLLERLGEGGCGTVYRAAQEEPVRREVALKVIKPGMDTRQVMARFEAERQALALMDHPHIARVLEAGATDAGRPYFVMELVRGPHLTRYCEENHLSTQARLELFIAVCQAIQHAHQKGVIHRDIKPSNILVTVQDGVPAPRIIDFGIAKATQQPWSDHPVTEVHQFLGTPAYMSPEQTIPGATDIDTRSDIHALGTLLYELLTGTTPLDATQLRSAGWEGMGRILREVEPVKPSKLVERERELRVERSRKAGAQASSTLNPQLKSLSTDLDWIVMKALEKDRSRRYESAAALAADVQRHLRHEPVVACPPTTLYQMRKFARRHRAGLATTVALAAALLGGALLSTWQAVRATQAERKQHQARQEAEAAAGRELRERRKSEGVASFLKSIFTAVAPSVAQGRDTRLLREVLARTSQRLTAELRNEPDLEAELRREMGTAYVGLNLRSEAEAMFREAVRLFRALPATNRWHDVGLALTLGDLGETLQNRGKLAEAEAAYREALPLQRKAFGADSAQVAHGLANFAVLLDACGDYAQSEATARQALALRRKQYGEVHRDVEHSLRNLAVTLDKRGALPEADECARQALAVSRQLHTNDHVDLANSLHTFASLRVRRGELDEGERLLREGLAMRRRLLGDAHPDLALSLSKLAAVCEARNDLAGAEAWHRETVAMQRKFTRGASSRLAVSLHNLATLLIRRGDEPAAAPLAREALEMQKKIFTNAHPDTATMLCTLAATCRAGGKIVEAEGLFREALTMDRALWTNNPARWEKSLAGLTDALTRQGKFAEAEPMLLASAGRVETGGPTASPARATFTQLVRLYEAWDAAAPQTGKLAEAERWRQKLSGLDRDEARPKP